MPELHDDPERLARIEQIVAAYETAEWHAIKGDTFNPDRPFGICRYLTLEENQAIDGDEAAPNTRTEVIAEVTSADHDVAAYDAHLLAAAPKMARLLRDLQGYLQRNIPYRAITGPEHQSLYARIGEVLISLIPPVSALDRFEVGQVVEHRQGGLRSGCCVYAIAVVVQAEPLVLASCDGDMLWSATTEDMRPYLKVVDNKAQVKYPGAFTRWAKHQEERS